LVPSPWSPGDAIERSGFDADRLGRYGRYTWPVGASAESRKNENAGDAYAKKGPA